MVFPDLYQQTKSSLSVNPEPLIGNPGFQEIIGEARKNSLAAVCAVAREQGVPVNGGDRKNQHNNRNTDTRQGNDPVYLARRILGADPGIFDQLERGELLKMSDEFQSEQQRIKDEGNRKRAEAAKAQEFKGNQYAAIETPKEPVVPMFVAPLPKPATPTQSPPSVITPTPPTPIVSTPPTPIAVAVKPPVYVPPPKVEISSSQ